MFFTKGWRRKVYIINVNPLSFTSTVVNHGVSDRGTGMCQRPWHRDVSATVAQGCVSDRGTGMCQ